MSDGKVVSLCGGPTGVLEPNATLVAALEAALEAARSGEIVGGVFAFEHFDGTAGFRLAGMCGGFVMLGALTAAHAELLDVVRGTD